MTARHEPEHSEGSDGAGEPADTPTTPAPPEKNPTQPRTRIDTQIPRRKKGRAVPPLASEWDRTSGELAPGLRTPSDKMVRGDAT